VNPYRMPSRRDCYDVRLGSWVRVVAGGYVKQVRRIWDMGYGFVIFVVCCERECCYEALDTSEVVLSDYSHESEMVVAS